MKKIFILCTIVGCASSAKAQQYQFKLSDSLKMVPQITLPGINSLPSVSDLPGVKAITNNGLKVNISPVDRMPVLALPVTDRMPVAKLESKIIDKMPILKLQPLEQPLKPTP
jgi:hypothetical protein